MKRQKNQFLTEAQFKAEISKCEYCEEKPCKEACPADCSPADFIMAASKGTKADFKRASLIILGSNPLGGICGSTCPDYHCMKACVHRTFDHAVNIPAVQSTIIQNARDAKSEPKFETHKLNGKKVAVIGAGPAGLGASAILAQKGYMVDIFDKSQVAGGMCNLIPDSRLDKKVLKADLDFFLKLGKIKFHKGKAIEHPELLKDKGYDAVVVCAGLGEELNLCIKGEEFSIPWMKFLHNVKPFGIKNKKVAVIGGGAVAVDCAMTAKIAGADSVEMICLEKLDEMPLTSVERNHILEHGIEVTGRTIVEKILHNGKKVKGLIVRKGVLPKEKVFHPRNITKDIATKPLQRQFDAVIIAIGGKSEFSVKKKDGLFYAGDMVNGPTTVVEAVAAGKNIALTVDSYVMEKKAHFIKKATKSRHILEGRDLLPVNIEADFFGRTIHSPFILSAAPPSDGYEQMHKAYEAGWSGGVMKTAFDDVPIHIPSEYMFAITQSTYGNCDNVSGHSLTRVCDEIGKLVAEFPDRLTLASTGGPVSGNDKEDKKVWQSNTVKLENAGVMGIEYSLSCPQGGDGTKGDIVSQDAELTAKIVGWVMEISNPEIPKLFKLTAAVTAIYPIIQAIKGVFAKYPDKKAGVTLANTFPSLTFRHKPKSKWDEGIVVGLSGEGVIPISNLTLANVSGLGITVSGNGGPMDYKSAADFLALGAKTVQFCTIVMKHGYGIINELHSGLSFLLESRGMKSVKELIGCALPNPITGFMELTSVKKISAVDQILCEHCGNCMRCPYQAIELNAKLIPETDPSKCIGCSICVQKCFAGALYMRDRKVSEMAVLEEA